MIDQELHQRFDRWLEKAEARGGTIEASVLRGSFTAARMRFIATDTAPIGPRGVYIATVAVKTKHQRQGVFTAFLEHCEATGRTIVVQWVENKHLQRFMASRPGYVKEDKTGGFAPTWRRS